MKPKNIMLLGFVNRAVEYLDRHLDDKSDPTLTELKNIDLVSLKKELSESLGFSFGSMQPAVDSLMNAGGDVFDQFIDAHAKTETLSEELERMLDVDFDSENVKEEPPKDEGSDLDKLLAFYNLDGVFNENQDEIPDLHPEMEKKENLYQEVSYQPAPYEEVEIPEYADDEKNLFEMSAEDNELLQKITENVNKVNNGESINQNESEYQAHELDSIFSEVLAHEDIAENEEEKEKMKKQAETDLSDDKKDTYIDDLFRYFDENDPNSMPNAFAVEERTPVSSNDTIDKDDIIKMVQDLQSSRDNYFKDEDLLGEFVESEDESGLYKQSEETEQDVEPGPAEELEKDDEEDDTYNSDLIDELRMKMMREDQEKETLQQELKETASHILEIYPYLNESFIMGVCSMKDVIANQYLTVSKVIVLHRLSFKDVENLRQFVEITLKHNYQINADEKKMIVDALVECSNTEKKIMSSIFDIANQAALLKGEYEGYRIMSEDDIK